MDADEMQTVMTSEKAMQPRDGETMALKDE